VVADSRSGRRSVALFRAGLVGLWGGARCSERNLASVWKRKFLHPSKRLGSIFGAVGENGNGVTEHKIVSGKTRSMHESRRNRLQSPVGYFAGVVFHIQIEINMRVDPVDLLKRSFQSDGLAPIEFSLKGMVCQSRQRRQLRTKRQ
jgi:hypothetical protein